jgi:hypothetical protein
LVEICEWVNKKLTMTKKNREGEYPSLWANFFPHPILHEGFKGEPKKDKA